jgi:hypothetical protein
MMGWNYGYVGSMMGSSFGFFGVLIYIVLLIDLILLGVWLWKKINK